MTGLSECLNIFSNWYCAMLQSSEYTVLKTEVCKKSASVLYLYDISLLSED